MVRAVPDERVGVFCGVETRDLGTKAESPRAEDPIFKDCVTNRPSIWDCSLSVRPSEVEGVEMG